MKRTRAGFLFVLSLGIAAPALAADIQVSAGGSINTALAAALPGDRVLVQAGTYHETVALVDGVELLGGYDASFSDLTRDPDVNVTMIHGDLARACMTSGPGVGATTLVDGFLLRGAGGSPGAPIIVQGGSPVFSNNEISGNHRAGITGGAYIHSGSTARFDGNRFLQNSAGGSGGAFRVESSSPVIVGNELDGNVSMLSGGAFYVVDSAMACSSNTIRNSRTGSGGGGAFYFQSVPAGGTIVGNVIEDCEAGNGGAVLVRDESIVTLENNTIRRCSATAVVGGLGGGVFAIGLSDVAIHNTRFEDCSATLHGGGVYAYDSQLRVTGDDPTQSNSLAAFSGCEAVIGRGGGIWAFGATDTTFNRIEGVRFTDCNAGDRGGGIHLLDSAFRVASNIFETCTALDGGGMSLNATLNPARRSAVANNTFYGCSAGLDPATNPGGAIVLEATINNVDPLYLAGNIVSNTLSGSCIRCRGPGSAGPRPTIHCTTFFNDAGNVSAVIGDAKCELSYDAGSANAQRDPGFCDPSPVDYSIKWDGTPGCDLETNCGQAVAITGLGVRGVDVAPCSCSGVAALVPASWGQIKARYR